MRKCNKKVISVLIIGISLVSCTPRLMHPLQRIYIGTDKKVKLISIGSSKPEDLPLSPKTLIRPAELQKIKKRQKGYFVQRSDTALPLTLQIDSIQKTVFLQPRKTYGWILNANCVCGLKKPLNTYTAKCWTYPRKNYITADGYNIHRVAFAPQKKGFTYPTISYSIPVFNIKNDIGHYNSAGVLGVQFGTDYFYQEKKFLSFSIGAATNILPLPIDYFGSGYHQRANALYTGVRNNNIQGRFEVGYGLSLSRLFYDRITYGDTINLDRSIKSTAIGFSFSAQYKITRYLQAGILYQPYLLDLSSSRLFAYQHFFSVQCTWNLPKRRKHH